MSKIQKLPAEMKEKKAFWMMDSSVGLTFTKNISLIDLHQESWCETFIFQANSGSMKLDESIGLKFCFFSNQRQIFFETRWGWGVSALGYSLCCQQPTTKQTARKHTVRLLSGHFLGNKVCDLITSCYYWHFLYWKTVKYSQMGLLV